VLAASRASFLSALLRPVDAVGASCDDDDSQSLFADGDGETITERPGPAAAARQPRDSGRSPSRPADLGLPARLAPRLGDPVARGDDADVFDEDPFNRERSSDNDGGGGSSGDGGKAASSADDDEEVVAGGSRPGNGSVADDAPNRCGRANGKNSDDDAYMAASADSSELSSDGQSV